MVLLSGCAAATNGNALPSTYQTGVNENYISSGGAVSVIAPDKRAAPVPYAATTLTGQSVSNRSLAGKVVVINFWYAGCPPCRAEAKYLNAAATSTAGASVQFLGVDVRDQKATAAAFDRDFKVPYPTILDANTGSMQLAFAGTVAPNAVPTTIVLDRQGRVAARVLGAMDGPGFLDSVIATELARKG